MVSSTSSRASFTTNSVCREVGFIMCYKSLCYSILLTLCIVCPVTAEHKENEIHSHHQEFGSRDLIAFWAGGRAFRNDENPYSQVIIQKYQQEVFPTREYSQAFLNPPWALPLFGMLGLLSFTQAHGFFLLGNIILYVLCVIIWARYEKLSSMPSLSILLISMPFLYCLWVGQISMFLTASLFVGTLLFTQGKKFTAGVLLGFACVKPHLFIVIAPWLLWRLIQAREWRFMLGGAAPLLVLTSLAYWQQPQIFTWWQQIDFQASLTKTGTITSFARETLLPYGSFWFELPLYAVPALGALLTPLIVPSKQEGMITIESMAVLLPLSLLFAPYALFYDSVFLFFTQAYLALLLHSREHEKMWKSRSIWFLYLALQISVLLLSQTGQKLQIFVYYPAVLFGVVMCARKLSEEKKS